jgi:hypothetical protein
MKMSQLHNSGTTWISRDKSTTRDWYDPAWKGHATKEMKRRRAHNKVAKKSRQVNYNNVR